MRIAYAMQMPVLEQGGVEVLVRTLIEHAPSSQQCYLISPDDPQAIAVSAISDLAGRHLRVPRNFLCRQWLSEMIEWLHCNRIDLCHFHLGGTYDMGAWSFFSCPMTWVAHHGFNTVVTNHQAVSFFSPDRPPASLLRRCAKQASVWPAKARQIEAVKWEASVSQHDLQITQKFFPLSADKLIQVYHSRLDATTPVFPSPPSHKILNVATIAFRKGQHILAEAFARIADDFREWSLDLVGSHAEPACIAHIESVIHHYNLEGRIRIHGSLPDPTPFYQDAEIYVQPSLLEGLGLSLQEAMFHGRACIGSTIGGIPELIDNPTVGFLFPAGDIAALAKSLARLMADPVQRTRLGTAARSSILERGMTRQAMSSNYRALYLQAIHSR